MKLVSYSYNQRNRVGIVEGDTVYRISFDVSMAELLKRGVLPEKTSERYPLADVRLHAPLVPGKILAVGRNYAEHAAELGNTVPEKALFFAKMPSCIVGSGEAITWRADFSSQVDWECELAVIIGKRGKDIPQDKVYDYIFGYTVVNDISARDLQQSESQWMRAKSADTFLPMGPVLVTKDEIPDPHTLALKTTVNGDVMQDSNTSLMIRNVPELVSELSSIMTLHPGDVILTGTPSGVGSGMNPPRFLGDGDTVTVSIDGICELTNPCKVIE
jgi:2-keto-4-pentenoate hydratase/2-oxohepta-3-ene-1,7-dioic acid hydratase in catechol pathway